MWNAAAGASEYQVQLTSECTLSSFRSCPFSSPVVDTRVTATVFRPQTPLPVSTTVPVGRRYYWRVRACNAGGCSAYSTVRYLDVGRHRKDVNGDGYADLIVGAFSQDNPESNEGQAYVYFGSATGPSLTPVTLDNPLDQAGGNFGTSVASAGDVNGDGYADLIVGASYQDNPELDEGQAYVYFGSATGPSVTPDVTLDNPLDQASGLFGISVASAGDVNGDGYADLIVGAYQQDNPETNEGQAYVYFGSATGPSVTPDVTLDNPLDQGNGRFGYSVASAGDVNGDGYADVIVGAHYQGNPEPNEGQAYVFFGSPTGPSATPNVTLDNPLDQAGGNFGISVASAGDVNGDGYADLIVGAYFQDNPETNEGQAYVYFGSATGPSVTPDVTLDNPLDQASGLFGYSVASAGDVNGDGYADLIVGAYFQDNPEQNEGQAYVFFGSPTGPSSTPDVRLDNPLDQANGSFGRSVASAGDVNGDGYADLIVGAYLQDNPEPGEGQAYVFFGSATGPSLTPDVTLDNPLDQASGSFGRSVASAGDVNGDGYADLIVGAYTQDNPRSYGLAHSTKGFPDASVVQLAAAPAPQADVVRQVQSVQLGGSSSHSIV